MCVTGVSGACGNGLLSSRCDDKEIEDGVMGESGMETVIMTFYDNCVSLCESFLKKQLTWCNRTRYNAYFRESI